MSIYNKTNMTERNKSKGDDAEHYFTGLTKAIKPQAVIIIANNDQNIYKHWDYNINNKKIDVKAEKCTHGNNKTIIEFTNRNGQDGWIYGQAEYIAFLSGYSFIIAKREEIIEFCNKVVQLKRVDNVMMVDALYKLISTPDQYGNLNDLITVIRYQDLLDLPSTVIMYDRKKIRDKYIN